MILINTRHFAITSTATDSAVAGTGQDYIFTPTAGGEISVKAGDIYGWFV